MKLTHIFGKGYCILKGCLAIILSFMMLFPSLGAFCAETFDFYAVDIRYSSVTIDSQPLDRVTYSSEDATYKVSDYPTIQERSLFVEGFPGGEFGAKFNVGKTSSSNLVIETSIAYRNEIATKKDLFCVETDNGNTYTLLTMDEQGKIKTHDGMHIYTVKKNYFYRISLIFDFLRQEYQVRVNNQYRVMKDFPEAFEIINAVSFSISEFLSANEMTYFKYFRAYEGDKLTNDTFMKEPKIADNSVFDVKPIPVPTEDEISNRNAGVVYVTSKTPRTRVYGTLRLIDSANPDLTPLYIDKCLLLPAKFASEILNAEVIEAGNVLTFSNTSNKIEFTIGSLVANKNGQQVNLKTAPVNKDGINFVPSDAVCSAFGYTSDTVNETTITAITKKGQEFDFDITADWKIFCAATREVIYEHPTTEEIVNLFNEKAPQKGHPRILLTPEKVEDLKVKIQREPYKSWFQSILDSANGHLISGVPNLKYETTDGTRMHHGSTCKDPLVSVGLAYQLTGDIKYAEFGADVLMKLCDTEIFPDWHPWHFLDVGHAAESVAIGFDWCYDGLTEDEKAHIVQVSRKYALEEVMKDYLDLPRERTWKWSSKSEPAYPQNWSELCPAAMNMLALCIGDEPSFGDQTIIGDVIREGMERSRDVQETFGPDGIYLDGFSYWNYATNVKVQGIESMFTALDTDFGSINAVGLRGTFDYIMYEDGPNGGANFGPNESTHQMSGLFHWAANRFNAPEYTIYCNDMLELRGGLGGWMHLIWYDDSLVGGEKAQIKQDMRSRYLPRLYFRQGFDDYDTWMAIYAGGTGTTTIGGSEQHGTYIVDMLGERWACDTGKEQGNYTGKFIRIKYYRNRAEGHNVILVNPGLDYNTNYNAPCSFVKMEADDVSSYAIYDYTEKYAFKGCTSYQRGFRLDKEYGNVLIQDEYKASKNSEFYWFMHTEGNIEIARDGKSAIIEKNNKKVLVNIVSPDKTLRFTKMAAVPLETSPQRSDPEESPNDKFQKLVIHTENVKEVNLAVEMTPLYATTPGYLNEEYVPLDDWKLYEQRLDKSLKLTSISVDGKPLDGFDPDKTRYSYHFPYNKLRGEVTATSDNAIVEVSEATLGNHLTRITLTAKDGSGRKNEYIIASQPYDYNEIRGFNVNADYINELPPDTKVVENVTVKADYVPQPTNNPENMLDGDIITRFSHDHRDEYAEFDLGDNYEITYLGVGHPFGTRSEYFRLEVSTDGKKWKTIMDRGTQIIGEAGLMYFGLEKPETFRYARIYHLGTSVSATKSSWWSISEIEFITPNK